MVKEQYLGKVVEKNDELYFRNVISKQDVLIKSDKDGDYVYAFGFKLYLVYSEKRKNRVLRLEKR